jgi:hypothetical protein
MTDLQGIELNKDMRLCSFDIENIYTNIPKGEIINIVNSITENNYKIDESAQKEIIHTLETVLEQNYFQVDQEYYKQTDGLAMGAPTSAVLAEIYIYNTWSTHKCTPS